MARTTLRPSASGEDYELRCPREYEAQLMDYARSFFPLIDLEWLSCPIKIVGADPTLPYSYLPTFDVGDVTRVDYDFIPDATHLLQLERPQECAAATREFLESRAVVGGSRNGRQRRTPGSGTETLPELGRQGIDARDAVPVSGFRARPTIDDRGEVACRYGFPIQWRRRSNG